MKVLHGFLDVAVEGPGAAVSIGNFDGVHRGHQAVIGSAVAAARGRGLTSVACTFDPHTRVLLAPQCPPRQLASLDQRLAAIQAMGVDIAVVIPFTESVAAQSREVFVEEFLVGALRARELHVSKDFRFGQGGRGDVEFLASIAAQMGFEVRVVPPVMSNGAPISSTRIRDAVQQGRMREAAALLGRPFTLVGEVVSGEGRGRDLHAPTANLDVAGLFLPARGVYVTAATTDGVTHPSVTNVGVKPTFGGGHDISVEAHLLEGGGQLYGKTVTLAFLKRLRAEMRFDGPAQLAAQIQRDIAEATDYFATAN